MKLTHFSLRRIGIVGLLLSLVCPALLISQTLTLFDIDASAYPTMRAKFYAFDASGHQLTGLAPGDIQLREDGIARTVTRVSCPPGSTPVAISSVLTMDRSGSMLKGSRIAAAQAAARAWVSALSLGRSECAVTSFDERAHLCQDFTTDRPALLKAIEGLSAGGGTDYDAALLTPPAGALEVCKRGNHKKVIVFLSDGHPNSPPQRSAIIAEALRQNVTIYAVILDMPAPQPVIDICARTGGAYFELLTTEAEATDIFLSILRTAQGGAPCELEWTSDGCATSRRLEVTLSGPAMAATMQCVIPSVVLPKFVFTPSGSLRFGEVMPGTQSRQQVTLTAQGSALHIKRVTVSNPHFSIIDFGGTAPPFTLGAGQSRTLSVEYAPTDSTYTYCRIDVQSEACFGMSFYADGGWRKKRAPQATVRVAHPNGGERLVASGEAELIWEGVMPEDTVWLEYSVDGGTNWLPISDAATGLRHAWRVPKQPSDRCLLRVTANIRPTFIGDMALIPAGTFRMGNITDHPDGEAWEKPVHEVTITHPFLMSRTEVTQEQYEAMMGSNPSVFKDPELPVETISWYEAVEFCNKLSRQEGFDTCFTGSGANIHCDFTANGYRLPTEAEWEYACRAVTETDFHTGNMTHSGPSPLDPALGRAGWYGGNSGSRTHPVGAKEPNAFGLYDMHGNVYEWCWDWFDSYSSGPAEDPRGPTSGSNRVLRGGSWLFDARYCRSADRGSLGGPDSRNYLFGFRVVRTY